ncbi:MAG: family N-acetyltransferase [Alphaproteobacteria bacterium]|nr:family N-acetyltransferase [Alphaproteobacteria bacterium]
MRHVSPHSRKDENAGTGFWRGTFSGRMDRNVAGGARAPCLLRRATPDEIAALLDRARAVVPLGDTAGVWRMIAKNPDIVQAVCLSPGGAPAGLFAFLPLNPFGTHAITGGGFDGGAPDPAWICRAGETPEAIYCWLVYAPRKLSRVLGAIARLVRTLAPDGVALFSRAMTWQSEHLQHSLGFLPARQIYPDAPDWLLVALPEGRMPSRARRHAAPRIEVEIVRTIQGLAQVFAIRAATYIAEQFCTFEEEFDGNDLCATQFVGLVDGDSAGAIRLRWFGEFAKLERLCVRREYRGSGLKERLIETAIEHARRKRYSRVYGHARSDLVDMWRRFGFEPISGRPPFRFANIDYVEILRELEPDPAGIRLGVPPMMMTRPEGAWDVPGPLDLSNVNSDPRRQALIARHTRFRERAKPA